MDELSSISLSGDGLHVECSSLLRTLSGHLRQYLGSVFDRWRLKFQATRGHAEHHSSGIIGFARRVPVRSSSLPVDIRHHIRWSKSKDPCECMRCSSVREMSTLVPTKNYCFFFLFARSAIQVQHLPSKQPTDIHPRICPWMASVGGFPVGLIAKCGVVDKPRVDPSRRRSGSP